jgi:autotransporter-associated beta strand protein
MKLKTRCLFPIALLVTVNAVSGQALVPKLTLWSNNFESNTVGQTTGVNPTVINGFRQSFIGGVVRDSSISEPFGPTNKYLELTPNNNTTNPSAGYRIIVNGILKASYTTSPVATSFDFNESTAPGYDTVIGFGTGTSDSQPDLNDAQAVASLKFRNGVVTLGAKTSLISGSLPSFTQGKNYRITYITNFTSDVHEVTGPDSSELTLEPKQFACWMYDPSTETYSTPVVVGNNNSRNLDAHVLLIFRHFSNTAENQRQTIYVDNLEAKSFGEPVPTWAGLGSDALWSTPANWQRDLPPVAGENVVFTGSANLSPDNDMPEDTQFSNISFESSTASFNLIGNRIELLGAISNASAANQAVQLPISINSTHAISNSTTGTKLSLDEIVSGSGSLEKTGTSTVTLTAANTYSGSTTITGTGTVGTHALEIFNFTNGGEPSSIGSSSNNAANLILNGGELRYAGIGDSSDRLFTIQANSFINNNGGGALSFTNPAAFEHANPTVTRTLNLGGTYLDGPNTFAPIITNPSETAFTGLTIRGGTWVVSATNTYTGNTTLNFGTKLSISSNANLGNASGVGKITLAGTLICTESLTLNSARGIYTGSGTAAGNGTIEVAAEKTVTHDGVISDNLSGSAIGADSFSKSGLGTLALGAANTYTGTTNIAAGTLRLGENSSFNNSSNITVRADATLDISSKTSTFPFLATQTLTGSGTISGQSITVAGTLAPGYQGIGTLTTASAAMEANSSLVIQTNSLDGTSDSLAISGNLDIHPDTVLVLSDTALTPGIIPNGDKLTLATYTGILTGSFKDQPEGSTVIIGENQFSLSYSDENAITLTSINPSAADPYTLWIDSFASLSDPAGKTKIADPDGDGRSNLEEFAFDSDPTNPANDGKIQSRLVSSDGNSYLTLTLPVRDSAVFSGAPSLTSTLVDGITYGIHGSFSLDAFSADVSEISPAPVTEPTLNTGWSYRSFRLNANTTEQSRGFLRAALTGEAQ